MTALLAEREAKPLVLRPLQAAAVDAVRDAFRAGHRNVLVQAPCGFGKTELATAMLQAASDHGTCAAFVCDRRALIDQTSQRFDKYGLSHGVIQGDHPRAQPWARVQLCSIQTIQRRRRWPEVALLVADEAHVLPGALKDRIQKRDIRTIGLTATPFTRGLGKYFDVVINAASTNQLIAEGLLCPFRIFSPSVPDMTGVRVVKGEYEEAETERRVLPIVGDVVSEYVQRGEGGKFICFAVSVAHAEALQRQFLGAGITASLYTYRQSDGERDAAVQEFRKPDSYIRGLISIESLTRGFDVADVGVLILARPLRSSLTVHVQMIGRVLRTAEGKAEALILDHAGNCRRFWHPTRDFFEQGLTKLDNGLKREQGAKRKMEREPYTCPTCAHVHDAEPFCPACGHEYPRRCNVEHRAGELSEMEEARLSQKSRQDVYSMLLHYARQHKKGTKWVAWRYRDWFGKWPRGLREVTKEPGEEVRSWIRSRNIAFAKSRRAA